MKLTFDQIEAAREMCKTMTKAVVAEHFGCARTTIVYWMRTKERLASIRPNERGPAAIKREGHERVVAFEPQILALLAGAELTAAEMAAKLGVEKVAYISAATISMERRSLIERERRLKIGKNMVPVWRLPREEVVEISVPAPPLPQLCYRSPMGEFLGEPAIGRSALDARGARA